MIGADTSISMRSISSADIRQGVGDAVDGQHHRLGHRVTPDPERIEAVRAAQGARAVLGHHRANLGQIQASRKVIAVPKQHTGA
jgi:hypothetical protein